MASTNNVSDTNTRFAKEELEEVFEELGQLKVVYQMKRLLYVRKNMV